MALPVGGGDPQVDPDDLAAVEATVQPCVGVDHGGAEGAGDDAASLAPAGAVGGEPGLELVQQPRLAGGMRRVAGRERRQWTERDARWSSVGEPCIEWSSPWSVAGPATGAPWCCC